MTCNSRKKGYSDLPKLPPGPWGGEGYCQRPAGWGTPLSGDGRCKLHGGLSPRGLQSPNYKHGENSKYFPSRLFEEAKRVYGDSVLHTLRLESELLAGRLVELLRDLPERTGGEVWQECRHALHDIQRAHDALDDDGLARAIARLVDVIQTGAEAEETWGNILRVIEQRRKVLAVENKRTYREENTITHEQAVLLVQSVIRVINDVLDRYRVDDHVREEIADGLLRVVHRN